MGETAGRLTLWGIEIFAAIAETRSMSAAGKRVGASPSAVSQQLSNLEAALGSILVDRAARPLQLTPAGEIFRHRASSILHEAALARTDLAAGDLSQLTRFRLGVIEDFDADVTPRLLSEMAGNLTACHFQLETGASHHLVGQLEARALDVVVTADIGAAEPWMDVYPLMTEPFVAALPLRDAALARDPGQLADLPLIQYTQRHHMGRQIAAHLTRHNLHPPQRFELDSYHAILAMVSEGAGWTILTPLGFLRAQRFADRVCLAPLPLPPLGRTIALTARRDILGEVPMRMASQLRSILDDLVVGPARADFPWLADALQTLP